MSGVYIPNIEMPINGNETIIRIQPDGTVLDQYGHHLAITAVPVPPHGDLIDRREAIIDANERAYDFWNCDADVDSTVSFLNEQTTIIPASEEGE